MHHLLLSLQLEGGKCAGQPHPDTEKYVYCHENIIKLDGKFLLTFARN